MTDAAPPPPSPQPRRSRRFRWRYLFVFAVLAGSGGAAWAWYFIQEQLAPTISQSVSQQFNRPFYLGRLERLTLSSLRFGPTVLPPTATDPDRATIDAIEVNFNLWQLWQRKFDFTATLINPKSYLEQDSQGLWVNTKINPPPEGGPIKLELTQLRLQNATVELLPQPKPKQSRQVVKMQAISGFVNIQDKAKRFSYFLRGDAAAQGKFRLRGESQRIIPTQITGLKGKAKIDVLSKLTLEAENFPLIDADRLIRLPIDVQSGQTDTQMDVTLNPDLSYSLKGQAKLKQVNLKSPEVPYPLRSVNGDVDLVDQSVILKGVKLKFDQIPMIATGKIDPEAGFDLMAVIPKLEMPTFFKTFKIKSPVPVIGTVAASVKMTGPVTAPQLAGSVRNLQPLIVDRLAIAQASGNFQLDAKSGRMRLTNLLAQPQVGGRLTGQGTMTVLGNQTVNLALNAVDMPADAIAQVYTGKMPPIKFGNVRSTINVNGRVDALVTRANWQAPQAQYPAQGDLVMTQNGRNIDLTRLVAQAYGGQVVATGKLRDRRWTTDAQIRQINLAQLNPQLQGTAQGTAQLQGDIDRPDIDQITGTVNLVAQTFGGELRTMTELRDQGWRSTVNVANLQLNPLNPDLRGAADGQVQLRGKLADLTVAATQVDGQLRLSQGVSLIQQPTDVAFNWDGRQINLRSAQAQGLQATGKLFVQTVGTPAITGLDLQVATQNLPLSVLPLNLPENVTVRGLSDFRGRIQGSPTAPKIQGQVALRGFGVNQLGFEPLAGAVALQPGRGTELNLTGANDRLTLRTDGNNQPLALNVKRGAFSAIGNAQGELFNLAVQSLPLSELATLDLPLPNLGGMLSGNLVWNTRRNELPQAKVTIAQATVGDFPTAFRSAQIQANVSYIQGQARGSVAFKQPRLGTILSDDVTTNFVYADQVFRVSDLVLRKADSQFKVAGSIDLRTPVPTLRASAQVTQGRIEDVLGAAQIFEIKDLFRTSLLPEYEAATKVGQLAVGAPAGSNVSLKTQLERLAELNMQIKQIAQRRQTLTEIGADGQTTTTILPDRLDLRGKFDSEMAIAFGAEGLAVEKFTLNAKNVEWRPYPGYAAVQRMNNRSAVVQNDTRVLQLQSVVLDASYKAGQLNLTRALAQIGEATASLQLNYGGEETFGQLDIAKLPISEIQRFYPFPGNITGEINLKTTLTGQRNQTQNSSSASNSTLSAPPKNRLDLTNLIGQGSIEITEGAINGTPIESARGFFGYNEGRINLASALRLEKDGEPLAIELDAPLPIPLIGLYPKNDRLEGTINVKNQGLALMNLFDSPAKWLGGEGAVTLNLGGDLTNVTAEGLVALKDASFEVQGLPEPLTNVNGQIRFDRDRVRVEQLAGQFSKGDVAVRGSIPLFNLATNLPIPDNLAVQDCLSADATQPLNIQLNKIALSYKGLYRGGVRGCVNVAGNLFEPKVTGEIALFSGQVLLADELPQGGGDPGAAAGSKGLTFNNLRLRLDRDIQIVKAPIVNFVAQGILTVNGNLDAPQPTGEIFLRSGQVNLFTTQFVLARGYPHRASFLPGRGLDPDIDVRLIASVPEVTRTSVQSQQSTFSSEVNDAPLFATNFGTLQTVRIEAKVDGPSSTLFDNLELSSSPSRSRNEIIGLIGGGFVDTLGRGDSTLGIANLAGSALLTNIQGAIGNALGLSEFRLFPTISTDEDRRSSTLGLAAEAGVDITPALSGSVLKILTSDKPAQFGVRYRINDNFLLRGSTDFSGDNRAVLEYNARF
jgi:translocation and assembly module TamB